MFVNWWEKIWKDTLKIKVVLCREKNFDRVQGNFHFFILPEFLQEHALPLNSEIIKMKKTYSVKVGIWMYTY